MNTKEYALQRLRFRRQQSAMISGLVLFACLVLVALGYASISHAQSAASAEVRVKSVSIDKVTSASTFLDSIGVDSHFSYPNATESIFSQRAMNALIGLNVWHIRDSAFTTDKSTFHIFTELAAHGIKHSLGIPVHATAEQIREVGEAQYADIDFAEVGNEYDASGDPNWVDTIRHEQAIAYHAIKSDPSIGHIPVLSPSMNIQGNAKQLGNLSNIVDATNLHNGQCNFNPGSTVWGYSIPLITNYVRSEAPDKPVWTTEAGYSSDPARPCLTPEDIAAAYIPRQLALRWELGFPRTYIYTFADEAYDHVFGRMGFIDAEGRPNPRYYALQSFIKLLADQNAMKPRLPSVKMMGDTDNVHAILLEKSDRSYWLVVWLELPSIDVTGNKVAHPVPQDITVQLAELPHDVEMYRYNPDWHFVEHHVGPSRAVHISVGDTIEVLKLQLTR